jgi:hypothetical protein
MLIPSFPENGFVAEIAAETPVLAGLVKAVHCKLLILVPFC